MNKVDFFYLFMYKSLKQVTRVSDRLPLMYFTLYYYAFNRIILMSLLLFRPEKRLNGPLTK